MLLQSNPQQKFIDLDERQNPIMTMKTIRYYLQKQLIPLNPPPKKLYLNCKGFTQIIPQTLYDISSQLQSLWLDHNSIKKISALDQCCSQLLCLYLNNNLIQKIDPLYNLKDLQTLNLSHNKIQRVQNLKYLTSLSNINLSHNFLTNQHSLMGLIQISNKLSNLELSNNQIVCAQQVFSVILRLYQLNCLYLKATPLNRGFKNYRKRLIGKLKKLKFLDDRPVLAEDHRLAQAFLKGGIQFQRQQRTRLNEQKQLKTKKIQQESQIKHQKQIEKKLQVINNKKKPLQQRLKQLQQKEQKTQNDFKQIKQLTRKIQDIRNPKPKGFLASITDTKIKIQNVSDQEQQRQIIEQYFQSEKEELQEKKKGLKAKEQRKTEIDKKFEEDHLGQLKNLLDKDSINNDQIENQIRIKWNKKYEPLLQALLQKYRFDFSQVQPSFNMIMADINKKMLRPHQRFQVKELRLIWTEVQKRRRKQKLNGDQQERENVQINK